MLNLPLDWWDWAPANGWGYQERTRIGVQAVEWQAAQERDYLIKHPLALMVMNEGGA